MTAASCGKECLQITTPSFISTLAALATSFKHNAHI